MRRGNARSAAQALVALWIAGCGPSGAAVPGSRGARAAAEPPGVTPVELRAAAERPPLALLEREGEPTGAVALAVAHDHGVAGSLALAALLRARLGRAGLGSAVLRPHALGLEVRAAVTTPAEAGRVIRLLGAALTEPAQGDASGRDAATRALATPLPAPRDLADECSALAGAGLAAPLAPERALALVDSVRAVAATRRAASFAAVGARPVLEAAARARDALAAWPEGAPPEDPWPAADSIEAAPAGGEAPTISVALRVGGGPRALAAARELRGPGAALSERLSALEPAWRVRGARGLLRVRGACVRVDLEPAASSQEPIAAPDAARAALIVADELAHALDLASDEPDETATAARDASEAAARAAWRTLVGQREPGRIARRALVYRARAPRADSAAFPGAVRALERQWGQSALDARSRAEPGHADVAILVASPCGTAAESAADAGATALALRAVGRRLAEPGDLEVASVLHADALGLLVRAARRSPREAPVGHALRLADAIGRALLHPIAAADADVERAGALQGFTGVQASAWAAVLDQLAPGRPSWLDPAGTPVSLAGLRPAVIEARRLAFAREPLRVAVSAPTSDATRAAATRLESWLRSARDAPEPCPAGPPTEARAGTIRLERRVSAPFAYVGVPLPSAGDTTRASLEAALARDPPGGEVRVLGGGRGGALVVAVRAQDSATLARAVEAARAGLARLPSLWSGEQRWAGGPAYPRRADADERLRRLWAGPAPGPSATLRVDLLAAAFALERHVVVIVEPPAPGQLAVR